MTNTIRKENGRIEDAMSSRIVDTAERIALAEGAHTVTVRRLLTELGITNRVFYNRFCNADEVLSLVYKRMIVRIRSDIVSEYDGTRDFFEYVMEVVEKSLIVSYESKMRFNQFIFESDSLSATSYEWWTYEIKKLIEYAKSHDLIKDVNSESLSYSIWCFCRGYNTDAAVRGLPLKEAIAHFRYGFGFLLEGLKK